MKTQYTQTYKTQKAFLRGKLVALHAYIKADKSRINNLITLEKQEEIACKKNRWSYMFKFRVEIDEMEAKINKTKSWVFFRKIKTDKPL